MRLFTPKETAALLPYPELARAIAGVLLEMACGKLEALPRLHDSLPGGGTLLVMPASDDKVAVTKLVTVHPGNPAQGLPLIQGEMVVMDAVSGKRLGVLDGPTVTARRTAALSLLAAQTLASRQDGSLLLVGAGVQARAHLEAFANGLGTRRVHCCSRSRESAGGMVAFARNLGVDATVVDSVEEAVKVCSLVVTATTSSVPVLPEVVASQAFIAAVGSFTPQAAEIPARLVRSCRVVVDTWETRHEAGDLIQAEVDWGGVELLADVLRDNQSHTPTGDAKGCLSKGVDVDRHGPVLFKSVGHALFDLAAGRLALAS
ncbi:delta(1)-pyrroline-2-carboxylate reductase family protein [Desulfovibrio ferrophilus]|uniref:Ornithine cyclodeaminase/mu-crystallin n=1 Tax=Desulfovibrio ferrophilus TaxID=241368 RepID=A0A2Z6AZ90_9BACT|nr:delta(1)-pyrroline-2-carboxylate reductase family protein [Desulfovibrio ferrophilus]BBD08559.1 ornithine cyclodeaminase/mu-crystallin [Desulfovibrio ferrophilus]